MIQTQNELIKVIDLINQKSPFQKKRLQGILSEKDEEFWRLAEGYLLSYEQFLRSEGLGIDYLVSGYLNMCQSMLKEQIKFLQTGKYSAPSQQACSNIYFDRNGMLSYMCGLALSQFLWKNHYAMFRFFGRQILQPGINALSYLEIGPGHGLFLTEALKNMRCQYYEAVDISPVSIELSKEIVRFMSNKSDLVNFKEMDMLDYDPSVTRFDFITMGEVIEHVDNPVVLLKKVKSLLSANGRAFVTTCSNCPAIDHVYLFNNVDEIRDMIHTCGFKIEDELVLPVESVVPVEMQNYKMGYNYAGVLK